MYVLRDYQITAIDNAFKHYRVDNNSRGKLIMPCGTGKTITSLGIIKKLHAREILVCVPSLALIKQLKDEWITNIDEAVSIYFICSNSDIDKNHDEIAIDITELGKNVSTDPIDIKIYLKQHKPSLRIIFCTYQSVTVLIEAIKEMPDFKFDLIICDEAHRTVGVFSKSPKTTGFSLVHNDTLLPANFRLYMTATPKILSKYHPHLKSSEISRSMDNVNVFGKEFYRMSFADAISRNILVDFKLIIVKLNEWDIINSIDKGENITKNISIEDIAHNYALDKVMHLYGAKHGITYHHTIQDAYEFSERHKRLFSHVNIEFVSGSQPWDERNIKIKQFTATPNSVLANSRCLIEGVDVPNIDLVYFADPKKSPIDILQTIGRALRKSTNNKTTGHIVVPIYLSDDLMATGEDLGGKYAPIINVARAIANEDERFYSRIVNYASHSQKLDLNKINLDIDFVGFDELKLANKIKESITSEILINSVEIFDVRLKQYQTFVENNGYLPRYRAEDYLENKLNVWATRQRHLYRNNIMESDNARKLENINFAFELKDDWLVGFDEFKLFIETHNRYPERGNDGEILMFKWVEYQRRAKRLGLLNPEQTKLLDLIDFIWDVLDNKWNIHLQELKDFIKLNGRLPKLIRKTPEFNLALWLDNQYYHIINGKINVERQRNLCSLLGENWTKNYRQSPIKNFNQRLEQLSTYYKLNDRLPTSMEHSAEDVSLNTWLRAQQKKYLKHEISNEQVELLDSITPIWKIPKIIKQMAIAERIKMINEFIHEFGKEPKANKNNKDEFKLYSMMSNIRQKYRCNKLSHNDLQILLNLDPSFLKD